MNAKVFDINNFNIISDNDNYYFIRALNMGDNNDIESNITTDSSGNIIKVRTDRERYTKEAKYDINSEISLEEIYDHIKMQHRTDTNCISLSSNCNVSLMYGRGYYKDRYILVKVPKDKLGQIVINAPEYMINEINKRIDEYINNGDLRDEDIYKLKTIDSIDSREELDIFINNNLKEDYIDSDFEEGITYRYDNTTTVDYQALNKEQNLLKNKIVAKLNIISNDIILNVSNKNLIKALGNAVSSLELIHYNDIDKESIIEVPKEIIDILALIQQLPKDNVYASDLKQEVLNYLNTNNNIEEFKYHNNNINSDNEYTISDMYELTNGNVSYYDAINIYKKSYYLAKSKLRTIDMINELNIITNNNPKYYETLNYLITHTYGIEPDIFSRQNTNRFVVSESVSLDFAYNEEELFNYINNLPNNDLETILNNPKSSLQTLINNMSFINKDNIFKEDYYANAIIDMFDWQSIGVKDFSYKHRLNLINKLKENKVVEIYDVLKSHNISEKRISNILLTNIIKGKDIADIDFKDTFTTRDLDEFLGYYKVKGTNNLVLRDYQASAHNNNNKIFEEKQFVADIVPTGGGKSFIALAQMLHNIDNYPNRSKKILYLAPNDVILEQIKDYIIENIAGDTVSKTREEKIKEVFPNLKLATYQSLTSFKEQASNNNHDIINDNYDLIILDELHRTGASEWSKYILELLNNQDKDTKVLGLTATPTRDMDSIDMAEEWARYFGYTEDEIKKHKHLGINMDLEYAIKLGYVMNPKIVECIYSLQEKDGFIDNLNEQINTITDIEVKNNYIRKLDKLRRKVSEAEGVEKILQSNIKRGEKYIIFCPVINKGETIESEDGYEVSGRITGDEAINNIIEEITNKLSGYINKEDIEFHKMLGTYGKAFNNNQLNKFNADTNPDKVKFMVVINKLNEGAHLKDVKGIIWYRPLDENSKILFLQQLGRIIYGLDPNKELSDDERTIAIDLVCNRLRVNLKDKLKTSDLDYINIIKDWSIAHDNKIPDINSLDKIERNYAKTLRRIKNKYLDYINDPSLIDKTLRKEETFEILKIGTELDIWSYDFPDIINDKNNTNSKEDEDIFNITGVLDDFYELQEEINYVTNLSTKQKIAEYIEKLNNGYKPKYFDDKEKFSDGTPVNQFWRSHRRKIKEELENNSKYKEGYDKAKQVLVEKNDKYLIKIHEFIEKMNNGYIPIVDDKKEKFSDGTPVNQFWKINKDKIKEELENNSKYQGSHDKAKQILFFKTVEKIDKHSIRINEFINKINNGYIPKKFDDKEVFSDGTPLNYFWYSNKDRIKEELDNNSKYRVGYNRAKEIFNMYINKDKKKENKELIKELCKEYNIDIKINKDIFNIPYSEVYVKLCYLIQYELPIVDNDGNINNIFYMSDINMQAHYNISLDELINKYIEARKMK